MMSSQKRQLQTFLLDEDERLFSLKLSMKYNEIIFLDDNVWNNEPKIVESINKCESHYCYIWNKKLFPDLPTIKIKGDRIQGPSSGIVIQFQRCRIDEDGNLLSGRIAVGYDSKNKEFGRFISDVWKILKGIGSVGVFHAPLCGPVDKSKIISDYIVGGSVKSAILNESLKGMKHKSTDNYYCPSQKSIWDRFQQK